MRSIPTLPAPREDVLAAVLDPSRLPTPPAVALQVVHAASRPDCRPAQIVSLLGRDPALCAKLLRAVNSCLYGLSHPIASLERAVVVLGLNTVRSLALGLSLPAVRMTNGTDSGLRDYWLSSVGGAIIARELTVAARGVSADDDLVAGLLRDLGAILLRQTYPVEWGALATGDRARWLEDPCEAELEVFGIDHADVGAELLRAWGLPQEIVEPIRHHHSPDRLSGTVGRLRVRAELLSFASLLVHLDEVAQHPALLQRLLDTAETQFRLSRTGLITFLERVIPKIDEFALLLNQDIGQCPDFAAILLAGSQELVNLTVEQSRNHLGENDPRAVTPPRPVEPSAPSGFDLVQTPAPAQTLEYRAGGLLPDSLSESVRDWPVAGSQMDGYEIRELLGQGAMGRVYLGYEPSLDRLIAIKMLAPKLAAAEVHRRRFVREAKVAAAIRHENVVAIYSVREAGGVSYLVMEYVDGGSLQDQLDAQGPLPVSKMIRIAREVAAGLAAAHAQGIVHRDIKPANILLDRKTGRAKITDFGLARVIDDVTVSREGGLVGTPLFMAPELIQGQSATTRSDLFSLGSVLYTLGAGKPPFPGDQIPVVLRAVCEKEPARLRDIRPDLPDWLDRMVLRLLRKDPAARFQSADEVVAMIPKG